MSQKRKNQRANHDAQEQKQAQKVIAWIGGTLLVLAVAYAVYAMTL